VLNDLSINHRTLRQLGLEALLAACIERGVGGVGVWREQIAELGIERCRKLVGDSGLQLTSLCRGGFFTGADGAPVGNLADNRRAIDEAAGLGATALVLVCGAAPDGDTGEGERRVTAALAELVPYAVERGVRLAIEPMHPMYCADRSVVVTIDQALRLAAPYPAEDVGLALDTYHIWWDPNLPEAIRRAAGRIHVFQVADWVEPLGHPLLSRGLPGAGVIHLRQIHERIREAGFEGLVEIEIFNEALWSRDGNAAFSDVCRAFIDHVGVQERR